MSGVPSDLELLRPWFNLIRRMQKAARDGGMMGVLTVRVIVDERGLPTHWAEPQRITVEPRVGRDQFEKLLEALDEQQTALLLEALGGKRG